MQSPAAGAGTHGGICRNQILKIQKTQGHRSQDLLSAKGFFCFTLLCFSGKLYSLVQAQRTPYMLCLTVDFLLIGTGGSSTLKQPARKVEDRLVAQQASG